MPHPTRRAVVASAASLVAMPYVARAASWPTASVSLVVPFPPGGSTDAVARLAQAGLQQRLGVPVIVENKPGASGSIGAALVARAKGDGGTWLFVFDTHAVNQTLYPNLGFDTEKDLDPVMLIGTAPNLVVTAPTKPYKSWADVVAAAKSTSGGLNYGSIGTGSIGHLTMFRIAKEAGVALTHVPYRGGGPLVNDVLAGHIDFGIGSAGLFAPQISAGTVRLLLQAGKERLGAFKDTPTAQEAGFAGLESVAWWGVFAPKGVPADLSKRFLDALGESLREEKVQHQLTDIQQIGVKLAGPDVLRPFLSEQIKTWGAVVKEAGIKPGT